MRAKPAMAALLLAVLLGGCSTLHIPGIKRVDTIPALAATSGYDSGKAKLKAGDPALALEDFRRDIAAHGPSVRSLNGLAAAYQALGRPDVAEQYLRQAYALDPDSPETTHNLSIARYEDGAFDDAVRFADLTKTLAAGATGYPERLRETIAANAARIAALAAEERQASWQSALRPQELAHAGVGLWTLNLTGRQAPPAGTRVEAAPPAPAPAAAAPVRKAAARPQSDVPDVRIVNVLGRDKMAARMARYLKTEGVAVNGLANARHYHWTRTEIRYRAGYREAAAKIAKLLPVPANLVETDDVRSEIELHLGGDLLSFDRSLEAA